jgi:hypothetical protein
MHTADRKQDGCKLFAVRLKLPPTAAAGHAPYKQPVEPRLYLCIIQADSLQHANFCNMQRNTVMLHGRTCRAWQLQ